MAQSLFMRGKTTPTGSGDLCESASELSKVYDTFILNMMQLAQGTADGTTGEGNNRAVDGDALFKSVREMNEMMDGMEREVAKRRELLLVEESPDIREAGSGSRDATLAVKSQLRDFQAFLLQER